MTIQAAMFLCFLATTSALAFPETAGNRARAEHDFVIQFPTQSIGKLFTMQESGDPFGLPSVGPFFCLAKGLVHIKPGLKLKFEPNMSFCQHSYVLSQFPAHSLDYLDLSKLEVTDEVLSAVGKVHTLRALKLEETDIDDDRMKKLDNLVDLQFLDISYNLIKGPGLLYLKASKDLRYLNLGGYTVDRDLGQYLTQFPKLGCLILFRDRIKDSDLASIAKTQTVKELQISNNNDITDDGIKALVPLKHLLKLDVSDTKVTPTGLLVLKGTPLVRIHIDNCFNNKTSLALLHKSFPQAEVIFPKPRINIPIEVFSPLH
jgi:hypothetical protein